MKTTTMNNNNTNANVTVTEIKALRREAREAGDTAQVELCERALSGDQAAWDTCVEVIEYANDMAHCG